MAVLGVVRALAAVAVLMVVDVVALGRPARALLIVAAIVGVHALLVRFAPHEGRKPGHDGVRRRVVWLWLAAEALCAGVVLGVALGVALALETLSSDG